MLIRPLQYDSLFLVLLPTYSRDTHILGHYLYLNCPVITWVCACYAISYSHGVSQHYGDPGKQRRYFIALEIAQCHSVWGEFYILLLLNSGHEVIRNNGIIHPPACFLYLMCDEKQWISLLWPNDTMKKQISCNLKHPRLYWKLYYQPATCFTHGLLVLKTASRFLQLSVGLCAIITSHLVLQCFSKSDVCFV